MTEQGAPAGARRARGERANGERPSGERPSGERASSSQRGRAFSSERAPEEEALHVQRREDGVAVVRIDVPGEPVNTLRGSFVGEFHRVFDTLEHDPHVDAVVFASGKKGSFIAGADIALFDQFRSAEDGVRLSRLGQEAMSRIAGFRKPVVAAIDGACLGGGLELALACHARIATDSPETALGLPEVQLGVLPGSGGTQRLPRLVGVSAALDMMLTGRRVRARRARRMGLVDDVVRASILIDVAAAAARSRVGQAEEQKRLSEMLSDREVLAEFALAGNPVGRALLFDQAHRRMMRKSRGNYPAPKRILQVVRLGLEDGFDAGLTAEARAFGELAASSESQHLRSLFFATTDLKKDSGSDEPVRPRPVRKVGVLGAGLMGAGVAHVTATKAKLPVRMKDRDADGVLSGLRYVRGLLDGDVKRRRRTASEAHTLMLQVSATTDFRGFADADVVVEAVFEDLALKQNMLREVERVGRDDVIFASNTSSIPIAHIAEASAHPETVVGMHYFSPVHKMPLLEVVATRDTAPWVVTTCVALGKKQGKHVIVVRDGAGFYTTRILIPFLNEAAHILSEGVSIEVIDGALVDFGFPVGPIKLIDEVGIDVGAKIGGVMKEALGDRAEPPAVLEKLIEDQRFGRKNKRGFYLYGGKKKGVDSSVYDALGIRLEKNPPEGRTVAWRCALAMVNEAARCFEEGILRSARDGDVGAVFGLGFPPFLGGPFRWIDWIGARDVVRRLRDLEKRYGPRFAPAPLLVSMAASDRTFFGRRQVQPGVRPRSQRASSGLLV